MDDAYRLGIAVLQAFDRETARNFGVGMKMAMLMHSRWLGDFHKCIVCDIPFPDSIHLADGHCLCDFGKWLALLNETPLSDRREVRELAHLHAALHDKARKLVALIEARAPVPPEQYQGFLTTHNQFLAEVSDLFYEVIRSDLQMDPLTGAIGRSAMEDILHREHVRSRRTGDPACLAMIDIDHLKTLNDTHGHKFGDEVISEIAKRLTKALRPYDLLFRYGGDEFLVCLPHADLPLAEQILERLRAALADCTMRSQAGVEVSATASFGVAELTGLTVEASIEAADRALYQAKHAGRNRVVGAS